MGALSREILDRVIDATEKAIRLAWRRREHELSLLELAKRKQMASQRADSQGQVSQSCDESVVCDKTRSGGNKWWSRVDLLRPLSIVYRSFPSCSEEIAQSIARRELRVIVALPLRRIYYTSGQPTRDEEEELGVS